MQVQVLPREISRGARNAATLSCRPEAIEATIHERVESVRRWRRAMAMGLSSWEVAAAVGVSMATLYRGGAATRSRARSGRSRCDSGSGREPRRAPSRPSDASTRPGAGGGSAICCVIRSEATVAPSRSRTRPSAASWPTW